MGIEIRVSHDIVMIRFNCEINYFPENHNGVIVRAEAFKAQTL